MRTAARAVEVARGVQTGGEKSVVFRDGVYEIGETVRVDARDAGLVLRAEHPGRAVLTGAKPVSGWTADARDPQVLVAPFPFEPDAWRLPTLVVNGRVADLSAYPSYGGKERMRYLADSSEIAKNNRTVLRYDLRDLPAGTDFRELDIASAFLFVPQEWCTSRCRIATNDWARHIFVLKDRTDMPIGQFNQGYQVVNTRLGLGREGAWMFEASSKRLFYRPRAGESAATLTASLSRTERLFDLSGARDIRFEGLVFEGGSAPFRGERDALPAACVAGDVVTNVVVEACEMRHSSGHGIYFNHEGNIAVRRCHFHDLGQSGVWFGYFGEVGEISDCHVHHNGRLSLGAAGAWAHMMHMTVVRNHVHDQPGCGLTLWTSHSLIASNRLHHTMRCIRDGGGLYGAQNFSVVCDNWCHDNGDWPGLYNDEGGRDTVYRGNRFDGDWWPTHMHDTYGIVMTNNVFTCDGCAMRFCFQGSAHAVFRDNIINTTIPIDDDAYLDNCDVWADNDIRLKQADGTYRSVGRLTLPKKPKPDKSVAEVTAQPGATAIVLDRTADGFAVGGVPGARARLSHDGTNLCVEGTYEYNKFISYPGSVNLGTSWGKHDAVRFYFDGFDITVFVGKGVVSSDPTLVLDPKTTYSEKRKSVGDGWARFGFRIPLARLGKGGFNAVSYNADHGEYKYYTQPRGNLIPCSRLVRKPHVVDWCARTRRTTVRHPDGRVEMRADWVKDRPILRGFVVGDGTDAGFRLQPFTGEDPADGERLQPGELASVTARPDIYGVSVENWALRTELTAAAETGCLRFAYDRGGTVKALLEADGTFSQANAVFTGKSGALFGTLRFDPAPIAVRDVSGGAGKRHVLEFFVRPIVGAVTVHAGVSSKSAADAAARAKGELRPFAAVRESCRKAWNRTLEPRAESALKATTGTSASNR